MKELDLFRNYMAHERNMSPNTIYNYMSDLKQFFEFCPKSVRRITSQDISDFIAYLHSQNFSATSTNRKLSAIKTFFKFLVRQGIIKASPADIIVGAKTERRLPRPINLQDIQKMIDTTDNLRDETIIQILYGMGIRRSELISIKKEDINFDEGYIRIFGKGNKERLVPLNHKTETLIKDYMKTHTSKWLFPSRINPDNHISARRLNAIISQWAKKSGLGSKNITPHKFRHTFCTTLFDNGADIKSIQDLAGHININSTNIYTRVSFKRNREEYLRCHPQATE